MSAFPTRSRSTSIERPRARLLIASPPYSSPGDPLDALTGYTGSSPGYEAYLSGIAEVVSRAPAETVVLEASNLKADDGSVTTLAWDIAREVGRVVPFRGEIVVTWEPTYGYDHSYCLVFG